MLLYGVIGLVFGFIGDWLIATGRGRVGCYSLCLSILAFLGLCFLCGAVIYTASRMSAFRSIRRNGSGSSGRCAGEVAPVLCIGMW